MVNATAPVMKSLTPGILHICICLLILSAIPSDAYAQVKKNKKSEISQRTVTPGSPDNGNISLENARVMVLTEDFNTAAIVYAQLLSKDSLNISLNSEYAYALALNGIYDAALARFDRFWGNKADNPDPAYFASGVYTLMGYDQLASEFLNDPSTNNAPLWIGSKAGELSEKYKNKLPSGAALTGDKIVENFTRANKLAAQGSYLQALGLFEEIIIQYPDEYLPYVGYSIVLEKTGLYDRSVWAVETAIKIIGTDPKQLEAKQYLDKRLSGLKAKTGTPQPKAETMIQAGVPPATKSMSMMLYAGGMISSAYTSVNSRFGYFLSESSNAAVDVGLSSASGNTSYNLGLSIYQRRKIFVAGFGLNGNFANKSNTFYGKISVGFSFINKRNRSSWDIFWDGQAPLSKNLATIVGMSIGRSIYFGTRN